MIDKKTLESVGKKLDGEWYTGHLMRSLYAVDASVYRELPLAVAYPKTEEDLQVLIQFARDHNSSLIPRTAGTSLAGQCVGSGVVVDFSKHFTKILELNTEDRWVRVQPGIIRDELNQYLAPYGLFFGPNTSTSNRCMIGGMVGNNSCGTTSIVYGSTRDHVRHLRAILSDGTAVNIDPLSKEAFIKKMEKDNLEGQVYRQAYEALLAEPIRKTIKEVFPKPGIHRRNTGYAVDLLLQSAPFEEGGKPFNFCELLTGSEGTLAFSTEITLQLDLLPPPHTVIVAAHFSTLEASLEATVIAMGHQPTACELMDKIILDCTKKNRAQAQNRFFVEGDPAAILCVEFKGHSLEEVRTLGQNLISHLQAAGKGYAFPLIEEADCKRVWHLRKAGLGLLSNIPGDKKAVACIEDTAVDIVDLPAYISDFTKLMDRFGQKAVYYAHAGAGEIHLRPILNLKSGADVKDFKAISKETAALVKQYRGSLSGEHGDGRVRAEFIELMYGKDVYDLFREIKNTWDPDHIFNPGKIVDAPPMDTSLRYPIDQPEVDIPSFFDFSADHGYLRAVERCNGSGDCRKTHHSEGAMCPSYHATRAEKETTRARANALRDWITYPQNGKSPFEEEALKEILDLCLSCKACKSECPSNVDMARLKAEFMHQYYQRKGIPFRSRMIAGINQTNRLLSYSPRLSNWLLSDEVLGGLIKKTLGIHRRRRIPRIAEVSLRAWYLKRKAPPSHDGKAVVLFCDEFTNYLDVTVGQAAVLLLERLGYKVHILEHPESGRAALSKGLLRMARGYAQRNVELFYPFIQREIPILGIEPSAILSFRDEYPVLVQEPWVEKAKALASHTWLVEEFIMQEIQAGRIVAEQFTEKSQKILLHGHCHQKALSSVDPTAFCLSLPQHYEVELIPSGCCGMAGSFGYEKEHYEISMDIGNLILFPKIKTAEEATLVAAPGTSCRHQIKDGTGRTALHPMEVLWEAILK